MRRALLTMTMLCALVPSLQPASADNHEGCIAIGTHTLQPLGQTPWSCHYFATGPSHYLALTQNPIHIWSVRNGQVHTFVYRGAPGPPHTDRIATRPGEKVFVSITCWNWLTSANCQPGDLGGRHGSIIAHSEI